MGKNSQAAQSGSQPNAIQDAFLSLMLREGAELSIFLVNGIRLRGKVQAYDAHSIILQLNGHEQLIYKKAISTAVPAAVDLG